ncbi:MAG: hypothetical protein WA902_03610 [Thermosynechococcaceae cyanobacterium]
MTEQKLAVPSDKEKEQALGMLKESNRQLEDTTIALDELIAIVEKRLSCQQYPRIRESERQALHKPLA